MAGNKPNIPARKFWHQGFIVSNDGIVRFRKQESRDRWLNAALDQGFKVEPVETQTGYGFQEVADGPPAE